MFANVLHAYFGVECPLCKRVKSLIELIMAFKFASILKFEDVHIINLTPSAQLPCFLEDLLGIVCFHGTQTILESWFSFHCLDFMRILCIWVLLISSSIVILSLFQDLHSVRQFVELATQ